MTRLSQILIQKLMAKTTTIGQKLRINMELIVIQTLFVSPLLLRLEVR
nr:MAG TPA: hypothetical protein [Caudoviricetes sp.]